jgi:hypothetical protein
MASKPDPKTTDVSPNDGSWHDVDSRWLFAIAGVIWTGVGILLLAYAVQWLAPESVPVELELIVAGVAVAVVFVRFVFHGIVRKNIDRIEAGPQRASAFAFQGWKSYLVTVFMIGLGITLRHSAIPKAWLAPIYLGIGIALLATSLLYHRHLFSHLFGSRKQ